MNDFDAIVVGGGVTGAAILYALARKGRTNVLLLDALGTAAGATQASGGPVRVHQGDWFLSNLAGESLSSFLRFEDEVGGSCGFRRTGSLFVEAKSRLAALRLEVGRLNARGGRLELFLFEAARERFPALDWDPDSVAVFEENAGSADPGAAAHAWIRASVALGAELRTGEEAREIVTERGCVTGVRTLAGLYSAPRVVLAAGAGTLPLMDPFGGRPALFVRTVQTARFQGRPPETHPAICDARRGVFARADGAGTTLVGRTGSPAAKAPLTLDIAEAERARREAAAICPWLRDASLSGGVRALAAATEDNRGVLGGSPAVGSLIVAAGWGAAGLSLAPAIARRVADMVTAD